MMRAPQEQLMMSSTGTTNDAETPQEQLMMRRAYSNNLKRFKIIIKISE